MALRAGTRRWLGASSQVSVDELHGQFAILTSDLAALQTLAEERHWEQQRENAALRTEVQVLDQRLNAFDKRLESHIGQTSASVSELANLQLIVEHNGELAEQLRGKLVGLDEQLRWESEDLRKGLAAIVERLERQRKAD